MLNSEVVTHCGVHKSKIFVCTNFGVLREYSFEGTLLQEYQLNSIKSIKGIISFFEFGYIILGDNTYSVSKRAMSLIYFQTSTEYESALKQDTDPFELKFLSSWILPNAIHEQLIELIKEESLDLQELKWGFDILKSSSNYPLKQIFAEESLKEKLSLVNKSVNTLKTCKFCPS